MTISTWLMILTLAIGGSSQPIVSDTAVCPIGTKCKIADNCWINGKLVTPCPDDAPPGGDPGEPVLPPP